MKVAFIGGEEAIRSKIAAVAKQWEDYASVRLDFVDHADTEIDAPESRQAFGNRSKSSLSELCYRKSAQVEPTSPDRYGRTVARIKCAGVDANVEQVRRGMAWVFVRYSTPESPLYPAQDEARATGRGLWADSAPVPTVGVATTSA